VTADKVIEVAEGWLGHYSAAGLRTPFGESTGYDGNLWAGSFIDFVFHTAGLTIPSCVYSPSGLAEFIKAGRFHSKPQPGDVVFFTFGTGDTFSVGHVGLVADLSRWKLTDGGVVGTIEGCVNSGLAKSDPSLTGVFRRVRSHQEIIGFGRPEFRPGRGYKTVTGQRALVKLESIRPGRRNKSVGIVQDGLGLTVSLRFPMTDMFDGPTQHAYARWQRVNGYVGNNANGVPDLRSLTRLGKVTGLFDVES